MPRAANSRFVSYSFDSTNGKLRLKYDVDGIVHTIHALYHDCPRLSADLWHRCIGELGLACLADISTAALSRHASSTCYGPGWRGRQLFLSACDALRLELLYQNERPLKFLRLKFTSPRAARSQIKIG